MTEHVDWDVKHQHKQAQMITKYLRQNKVVMQYGRTPFCHANKSVSWLFSIESSLAHSGSDQFMQQHNYHYLSVIWRIQERTAKKTVKTQMRQLLQ